MNRNYSGVIIPIDSGIDEIYFNASFSRIRPHLNIGLGIDLFSE